MLDRKGILVFKRDTDALVASLRGALTLHKALKGAQLSLYSPSYPPPNLPTSHNANLTLTTHCMSLKEQCSHSVHSTNIRDKIYKLNAGGFLFKLADYFCKTQSRIPKDNSFGHWWAHRIWSVRRAAEVESFDGFNAWWGRN